MSSTYKENSGFMKEIETLASAELSYFMWRSYDGFLKQRIVKEVMRDLLIEKPSEFQSKYQDIFKDKKTSNMVPLPIGFYYVDDSSKQGNINFLAEELSYVLRPVRIAYIKDLEKRLKKFKEQEEKDYIGNPSREQEGKDHKDDDSNEEVRSLDTQSTEDNFDVMSDDELIERLDTLFSFFEGDEGPYNKCAYTGILNPYPKVDDPKVENIVDAVLGLSYVSAWNRYLNKLGEVTSDILRSLWAVKPVLSGGYSKAGYLGPLKKSLTNLSEVPSGSRNLTIDDQNRFLESAKETSYAIGRSFEDIAVSIGRGALNLGNSIWSLLKLLGEGVGFLIKKAFHKSSDSEINDIDIEFKKLYGIFLEKNDTTKNEVDEGGKTISQTTEYALTDAEFQIVKDNGKIYSFYNEFDNLDIDYNIDVKSSKKLSDIRDIIVNITKMEYDKRMALGTSNSQYNYYKLMDEPMKLFYLYGNASLKTVSFNSIKDQFSPVANATPMLDQNLTKKYLQEIYGANDKRIYLYYSTENKKTFEKIKVDDNKFTYKMISSSNTSSNRYHDNNLNFRSFDFLIGGRPVEECATPKFKKVFENWEFFCYGDPPEISKNFGHIIKNEVLDDYLLRKRKENGIDPDLESSSSSIMGILEKEIAVVRSSIKDLEDKYMDIDRFTSSAEFTGYNGTTFINHKERKLIIAQVGTQIREADDVISDLEVGALGFAQQTLMATLFYDYTIYRVKKFFYDYKGDDPILKEIKDEFDSGKDVADIYNINITGHSLGGYLAQAVHVYSDLKHHTSTYSALGFSSYNKRVTVRDIVTLGRFLEGYIVSPQGIYGKLVHNGYLEFNLLGAGSTPTKKIEEDDSFIQLLDDLWGIKMHILNDSSQIKDIKERGRGKQLSLDLLKIVANRNILDYIITASVDIKEVFMENIVGIMHLGAFKLLMETSAFSKLFDFSKDILFSGKAKYRTLLVLASSMGLGVYNKDKGTFLVDGIKDSIFGLKGLAGAISEMTVLFGRLVSFILRQGFGLTQAVFQPIVQLFVSDEKKFEIRYRYTLYVYQHLKYTHKANKYWEYRSDRERCNIINYFDKRDWTAVIVPHFGLDCECSSGYAPISYEKELYGPDIKIYQEYGTSVAQTLGGFTFAFHGAEFYFPFIDDDGYLLEVDSEGRKKAISDDETFKKTFLSKDEFLKRKDQFYEDFQLSDFLKFENKYISIYRNIVEDTIEGMAQFGYIYGLPMHKDFLKNAIKSFVIHMGGVSKGEIYKEKGTHIIPSLTTKTMISTSDNIGKFKEHFIYRPVYYDIEKENIRDGWKGIPDNKIKLTEDYFISESRKYDGCYTLLREYKDKFLESTLKEAFSSYRFYSYEAAINFLHYFSYWKDITFYDSDDISGIVVELLSHILNVIGLWDEDERELIEGVEALKDTIRSVDIEGLKSKIRAKRKTIEKDTEIEDSTKDYQMKLQEKNEVMARQLEGIFNSEIVKKILDLNGKKMKNYGIDPFDRSYENFDPILIESKKENSRDLLREFYERLLVVGEYKKASYKKSSRVPVPANGVINKLYIALRNNIQRQFDKGSQKYNSYHVAKNANSTYGELPNESTLDESINKSAWNRIAILGQFTNISNLGGIIGGEPIKIEVASYGDQEEIFERINNNRDSSDIGSDLKGQGGSGLSCVTTVCSGAKIVCSKGSNPGVLSSTGKPSSYLEKGRPVLLNKDFTISKIVSCSGSGSCNFIQSTPWTAISLDKTTNGHVQLTSKSTIVCTRGGVIKIVDALGITKILQ